MKVGRTSLSYIPYCDIVVDVRVVQEDNMYIVEVSRTPTRSIKEALLSHVEFER
jgi:hypothetical protein